MEHKLRLLSFSLVVAGLVAVSFAVYFVRSNKSTLTTASVCYIINSTATAHNNFSTSENVCGSVEPDSWQNVYSRLHSEILSGKRKARGLVWVCDDTSFCGGMGDRFRGIVMMFYLALLTGRAFFIHQSKPCSLTEVLLPSSIRFNTSPLLKQRCNPFDSDMCPYAYDDLPNDVDFQRLFGHWDTLKGKIINDHNANRAWVDGYFKTINWEPSLLRIRSNRDTPMYNPNFILDLIVYFEGLKGKHPMWDEVLQDNSSQKIIQGLKTIKPGYGMSCAMQFLFKPSAFLLETLSEKTAAVFKVPKTIVSSLVFNNFQAVPRGSSRNTRGSISSLTDFMQNYGMTLVKQTNGTEHNGTKEISKVIALHIRVGQGDGIGFKDRGPARVRIAELGKIYDCAKRFVKHMKWQWEEVLIMVLSDSPVVRQKVSEDLGQNCVSIPTEAKMHHEDERASLRPKNAMEIRRSLALTTSENMMMSFADAALLTYSGFGEVGISWGFIPQDSVARYWKDIWAYGASYKEFQCLLPGIKSSVDEI